MVTLLVSIVGLGLNMIRIPNGVLQLLSDDRNYTAAYNNTTSSPLESERQRAGDSRDIDSMYSFISRLQPEEQSKGYERRLVWLMSYPNSGTSYTLSNTLAATNVSVATNYLRQGKVRDLLDPENLPYGPFLLNSSLRCPSLILTKTHCNMQYRLDEFASGCRTVRHTINGTMFEHLYPVELVEKAVHLIRHPLDNLVARMHHGMKKFRNELPDSVLSTVPADKVRFHNWCAFLDRKFGVFATQFQFTPESYALVRSIPCFSDLLHYVNWHNRAGQVIDQLQLPFHVVYFEDYTSRYDAATRDLFDFLGLEQVQQPKPFIPGKTYHHYFDEREIRAISEILWETANPRTRNLLSYYLRNNETTLATTVRIATVS